MTVAALFTARTDSARAPRARFRFQVLRHALRNAVLFPGAVMPVVIGRGQIAASNRAEQLKRRIDVSRALGAEMIQMAGGRLQEISRQTPGTLSLPGGPPGLRGRPEIGRGVCPKGGHCAGAQTPYREHGNSPTRPKSFRPSSRAQTLLSLPHGSSEVTPAPARVMTHGSDV